MKIPIKVRTVLVNYWVHFFLIALITLFSVLEPSFFSVRNFNNILISSTAILLLSTAETFVIITGGIDLSIGFIMGFAAVSSASVMQMLYDKGAGYGDGVSILLGIGVGLSVGVLPGLVNGVLVAKLRVPPFIATLGMYGIANGVALKICGGFPITFLPELTGKIGNSYLLYYSPKVGFSLFDKPILTERADILGLMGFVPFSVLVTVIIMMICGFVLAKTRFGQHTYAIGGNMEAAVRAGVNVPRHLIKTYVLSAFLSSCAGVLLVLRFTMGNHTQFGATYELFAIAAVVIGGASLMGGSGKMIGTAVGVILLGTLEIGFVILGVEVFFRYIAVGTILIFAVFIDQMFPDLVYHN